MTSCDVELLLNACRSSGKDMLGCIMKVNYTLFCVSLNKLLYDYEQLNLCNSNTP